ncbi:hypothetical protein [Alkalihalobacillus sp. LMS39]|uniref:hypothetical protein n=1 Tax=Alkalihalobacillus sp. LMS39 TaxID=2924032 RepID=UPI001FB55BCA|nr:hypothetical protein [Alkalihalobacillus sp. LMS39]UOE95594.1 hypothetical protein MM271_08300 [Alkalihalobacillus sp. LMS39]
MNKKERLLSMIEQFETGANQIPNELQSQLNEAKKHLKKLGDEQVETTTNNVFSTPAHNHEMREDDPEFILYRCYDEMEKVAREQTNAQMEEALKQMRYYFSINEKDGYFP